MNSRVMMVIAVVLVVASMVVGYLGVSMGREGSGGASAAAGESSRTPPPEKRAAESPVSDDKPQDDKRVEVVALARNLSAHQPITEDDLVVERVRLMPPGAFAEPQAVIGRTAWRDLPAGTILIAANFSAGGPLARMIRSGERALAVKYDALMGAGGHLQPGDYVDVLLFLREDERNGDRTMQVVVPALRVLSVGAHLGVDLNGQPAPESAMTDETKTSSGKSRVARRESSQASTAVLAVPEELLTRFALAAEVGELKLAVRSAEEHRLEKYLAGEEQLEEINQQLFQFEKFALSQARRPQEGLVAPPPRRSSPGSRLSVVG